MQNGAATSDEHLVQRLGLKMQMSSVYLNDAHDLVRAMVIGEGDIMQS